MNRRTLLATAFCASLTPAIALADGMVDYTPGLIQQALTDGKTVFVDFAADWCSTCARQERIINALRADNTAYDEAMMFVRVDWDAYGNADVATSRNIPRRSTLLLLRGEEELGRIVAGTSTAQIQELMDMGVDQPS